VKQGFAAILVDRASPPGKNRTHKRNIMSRILEPMVPLPLVVEADGPSRRGVLTGLTGLAILGFAGTASAATPAGNVSRLQGSAVARRGANELSLAADNPVFVNDTISTGSQARLVLALQGGSTLRMGADARIRIDRFLGRKGGIIDLEAGPMLFDRPERARKTNIEFRSAFAVVAVRGTRFFAGPSKGVFGVFVERGRLDVIAAGKTVRLGAGQGSSIAKEGDPPGDAVPWGKPRIEAALASVS
jgi:ferric-dicitrate binding protein FerR (iron transport regulator)